MSSLPTTAAKAATNARKADMKAEPPSLAQLRRQVQKLLESKSGIDESRAKQLRKQWEQWEAQTPRAGTMASKIEMENTVEKNNAEEAETNAVAKVGEVDEVTELFSQLHQRINAQVELREKQFTEISEKLQRLRASLESGQSKQSQQLAESITQTMRKIFGLSTARRQKIMDELEELQPQIRELTKWRKWGTQQAREKLIDEVKGLHKSGASLSEIAERIKKARQQWREWDIGGDSAHHKLYQVFDAVCHKAYKPCEEHFAKQKKELQRGSEIRNKICEDLERVYEEVNWHRADWKSLRELVRKKRKQWRESPLVEYRLKRTLKRRFIAIMEQFNEKMDFERERNYKLREKLIAEAVELTKRDNPREAYAEMRTLHERWKPTVLSSPEQEEDLWARFSEASKQVSKQRTAERKEFRRVLQQNLEKRQALCAEIENSGKCEGVDKDGEALRRKLGGWQSAWQEMGEVPREAREKINARFRTAVKQARRHINEVIATETQQRRDLLYQKSMLCARVEDIALAISEADSAPLKDESAKVEKLHTKWEKFAPLPTDSEQLLSVRYEIARAALGDGKARKKLCIALEENTTRLGKLILQLEILVGLDSPAKFSKQRMDLQIQRLSAAMGGRVRLNTRINGSNNNDGSQTNAPPTTALAAALSASTPAAQSQSAEQPQRVLREILLVGAVDTEQRKALFKRLEKCRTVLAEREQARQAKKQRAEQKEHVKAEDAKSDARKSVKPKGKQQNSAEVKPAKSKPAKPQSEPEKLEATPEREAKQE